MRLQTRITFSALAGASLIGTLAGCTSAATTSTTSTSNTASGPSGTTNASTYKDGSYKETGNYQSPSGASSVQVKVTLKSNVVTAVTVTPDATNPTSKAYQNAFVSGISTEVVGKKLNQLNVSKVSGSSLTSQGFNDAISKIKTDAGA
jgi:uncharacterized protein with FMN-binding domain